MCSQGAKCYVPPPVAVVFHNSATYSALELPQLLPRKSGTQLLAIHVLQHDTPAGSMPAVQELLLTCCSVAWETAASSPTVCTDSCRATCSPNLPPSWRSLEMGSGPSRPEARDRVGQGE